MQKCLLCEKTKKELRKEKLACNECENWIQQRKENIKNKYKEAS